MQVKSLKRLEDEPASNTDGMLIALRLARAELVDTLIIVREPVEINRLQGALEFADKVISKLEINNKS